MYSFGLPHSEIWKWSTPSEPPVAPFENGLLAAVFDASMKVSMPLTIAVVYFSAVHFINPIVIDRQKRKARLEKESLTEVQVKRLRPAPVKVAETSVFKALVFLHNVFLCVYSVWTFIGMLRCFGRTAASMSLKYNSQHKLSNFIYAVCDVENGVFKQDSLTKNLTIYGWWFYMSKFYEVIDTIIILMKGRPSSLLQSYHHAGAMMCMWSGIRYRSPPIWIFVVFNSFIHSLMYFYFSLCCLKVRVPMIVKRVLTSLQISQFVVGGSLAVFHAFVWYWDQQSNTFNNCIKSAEQALPLMINVAYLTPLTMLFAAFYIESYIKGGKKTS
ncbi:hypothetical protein FT663_04906 [Candidozyma haemuli var. vulneris]|uniref:Elongation of fatty acids protein n=1 Tax=Candidozyma haemuli TaxID=45357 RepID=A0A2V1ASB3_9ASCO|nr:hypothetical protein CXQ85_004212 [[Candida] haemuloni]KAF3986389.1 hypothetical protein FT663_04906 [[Candida] haemuloni var. vulneris]KAF3991530.1 hypothetical protein FT662_01649 [[Candida] haemuloni var. vulneris]PVH20708.1 hypothetical protein CXQ85_004212 [[Candida] haemuloni]